MCVPVSSYSDVTIKVFKCGELTNWRRHWGGPGWAIMEHPLGPRRGTEIRRRQLELELQLQIPPTSCLEERANSQFASLASWQPVDAWE